MKKLILLRTAALLAVITLNLKLETLNCFAQNIAFVAGATASDGTTGTLTSLTIAMPAGVIANDIMIASIVLGSIGNTNNVNVTPPTGWIIIKKASEINVFYKIAGAAEPPNYSFTFATQDNAAGGILAYRNVSLINPIDTFSFVSDDPSGGTTTTIPSLTTTIANTMLLSLYGQSDNQGASPYTGPAGATEQFDLGSAVTNEYDAWAAGYDELFPTAGTTGTRIGTAPAANGSGSGVLIALTPQNITGIANVLKERSVRVLPNPSTGKFLIDSDREISTLEVFNALGELIYGSTSHGMKKEVDLTAQPRGIYFAKIVSGDYGVVKKLVIK